jgi:hypothetical protein
MSSGHSDDSAKDEGYKPWKDIEKELEARKKDVENTMSLLRARDSSLLVEVAKLLRGGKGGLPDYTKIEEGHENYDAGLAKKVKELTEKVYSVDYELDLFYDMFDPKKVEPGSHYRRMIENIVSKHKFQVQKTIGKSKFAEQVAQIQSRAQQQYEQEQLDLAVGDVDVKEHGDQWYQHLVDKYKVDKKRVSKDIFRHNLADITRYEYLGRLDKSTLYDLTKGY